MGRPLKKSFFGPQSDLGKQITTDAVNFGAGVVTANLVIVGQKSTRKYKVTDGVTLGTCKTVDKLSGDLLPGEMLITAESADNPGVKFNVRKITAHRIYGFDGSMYVWNDLANMQAESQNITPKGKAKPDPAPNEAPIEQAGFVGGDDDNVADDGIELPPQP